MSSLEFKLAARSLLLPIATAHENAFIDFASDCLTEMGVTEAEQPGWLVLQLRMFRQDGAPGRELALLVSKCLGVKARAKKTFMFESLEGASSEALEEAAKRCAKNYFKIHRGLIDKHLFTHDAARQLMSYTGLIVRLAVDDRMTASEISRFISTRDRRLELSWSAVDTILSSLGCARKLTKELITNSFKEDSDAEPTLFGDLDLEGSIEKIANVASELGCPGDFRAWLGNIFIDDQHAPYLAMLHYQLLIQDHYDHALTYLYEFKPRGALVDWLDKQYVKAGIDVRRNPFLNNAKAILRLDQAWASGRTDSLRSAVSLASLLEQMESLSSSAKTELAAHIRALLNRYIRIEAEKAKGGLPFKLPTLTLKRATSLLDGVAAGNTGTTGIIEQRLVDCVGMLRHPVASDWSHKGIGDSVFASNTHRKKFGDCEFIQLVNPTEPALTAYESHAGKLTNYYVDDHLVSFRNTLLVRVEELEAVAKLDKWQFTVVFIAHALDRDLPAKTIVELPKLAKSVTVALKYELFKDLPASLAANPDLPRVASDLVRERLNDLFVPPKVREKVLALMA